MIPKTLLVGTLCVAPLFLGAAENGAAAYVITARGLNHRVWEKQTVVETAVGFRTNVASYVELASGLHLPQPDGSFVPANPSFVITANGAEAQNTRHTVALAADIHLEEAVQITMTDGATLRGTPTGFGYYDPVTGQQLILATLKSAVGWLISSNEIVYSNCFNGVRASIHCQNRISGFSQSLLLHEQVPPPEAFGFSPRTRLQLFTQFATNQSPPLQTQRLISSERDPAVRAMMVSPDFTDVALMFGTARMGAGRAFGTDDGLALKPIGATRAPVGKSYGVIDGKNILIEAVEYERIKNALTNLPPPAWSGITNASISTEHSLPIPRLAKLTQERIQRAAAIKRLPTASQYAFVIDYEVLSSSESDYHFIADTTYFISSTLSLYGDTVFEGGAVVKVGDNGGMIFFGSTMETRTSAYRPLVITSFCDDSIGTRISGSTGVPTNYTWALYIESELDRPLHDFRISYADEALTPVYYGGNPYEFSHAQFVHCGIAVYVNADCILRNVLMTDVGTGFDSAFYVSVEHGTFDRISTLNVLNDLRLTNCLLVAVTNTGSYSGTNNASESDPSAVFSTVGAGAHYLATGSTNRNAGTTNINASLARDLRQRTTYAPTVITNATISTNLTLNITARRGTNALPDLGYAYAPLDYVFGSNVLTNATLTIPAGVALGTFTPGSNTHGLLLKSGSSVIGTGSPTSLARIVRYNTVQELASVWNTAYPGASLREPAGPHVVPPSGTFRFTDWSVPSGEPVHIDAKTGNTNTFSFQDSAFAGGRVDSDRPQFWFTNCLFQRVVGYLSEVPGKNTNRWYNNTFLGGTWTFYNSGSGVWEIFNNAFYDTADLGTDAGGVMQGWNAYLPGAPWVNGYLSNSIVTNIVFQTGPLGDFYLTNTSPLLNRGTNTAPSYGLYHFTVTTNQTKETNSRTDIGFHYVALNGNNLALDGDSDGLPDYFEDANGNGTAETNSAPFETDWNNSDTDGDGMPDGWEIANGLNPLSNDASDDPDGDDLTNLQEYNGGTNSTNPHDQWIVRWGVSTPGNIPAGTSVAMIGGGVSHSVALLSNGLVGAWGENTYCQTNVPAGLNTVTAIAAKLRHNLALRADGTVATWGQWYYGTSSVPSGLNDVAGIAAGINHDLACKSDGTVRAWGAAAVTNEPYVLVPSGLSNVVAVAGGDVHSVALKTDRTITTWGLDTIQFFNFGLLTVPPGATNVVAIAAGNYHTLALKADGTVVAWGAGNSTNVNDGFEQQQSVVPVGLSNVIAIAAGGYNSMALKNDETIAGWGECKSIIPQGLTNIVVIGAGDGHCFAVKAGRHVPLIIAQPPAEICRLVGSSVTFTGTALARASMRYQWQYNGANISGATNDLLTLTNVQLSNEGTYRVVVSNGAGFTTSAGTVLCMVAPPQIASVTPLSPLTVAFGSNVTLQAQFTNAQGNCTLPFTFAWTFNGQHIFSPNGSNFSFVASNGTAGIYTLSVANGAGETNTSWTVNIIGEGSPVWWGRPVWWGNMGTQTWNSFTGTVDTLALAVGGNHGLVLRENGTVLAWGTNDFGQTNIPANLTNTVSVAAGDNHSLALRSDGTVVAWGRNNSGQTNVPSSVTNTVAISAGGNQSLALRNDGSVIQWGATFASVPSNLTNVAAIGSGTSFHMALLSNATVVAWGKNSSGQTSVPGGLTNVVAIAAGGSHGLALKATGTVVSWGLNTSGQTNVPANLTNVMNVAAGYTHSLALRNDGTTIAWGDNTYGQTNTLEWLTTIKLIAAGGNQSAASMFSPLVEHPVVVSKDLLLIYNTNSIDSSNVCAYYLAHRPLVGSANVLGIACTNREMVTPTEFTNTIANPVLNWLAQNPTKRPQYVILFFDIPTRVNTNILYDGFTPNPFLGTPGVAYRLHTLSAGWRPFITSINMNGTNDCRAYIDKLEVFGANYSPGKLMISASAGGYNNSRYFFDDARHRPYSPFTYLAKDGVLAAGAAGSNVLYTTDVNIARGTNVAGYMSWGFHSSLGYDYITSGEVTFTGSSQWYLIETIESLNGLRSEQFSQWFSSNAFGGANYSNTPVAAVTQVEEPQIPGLNEPREFFGSWASGKAFGNVVWYTRRTDRLQAVGDPFVKR